MTNTTQQNKLQELINGLAEDFRPLVQDIERRIETTQNHYGDYGAVLSKFSGGNRQKAEIFALAMMKAGGNKIGISNGLKLFC